MLRLQALALIVGGLVALPACTFGMNYGGDTHGLERQSIPVGEDGARQLSYLSAGHRSQPRVIFIHGSPGRATGYVSYLHDPVDGHQVIAVDRLGYGESGGAAVTSLEEQAAAVAPLLVQRDGRWPILVGHSLGGPIACRLAADQPGKVGGLIVAGGALDPGLEEIRWYNRVMATPIVNLTAHEKLRVSNREILATRSELELLAPLLATIRCPIVIVHGTQDSLVPYDNVGFMLDNFSGSQQVKVVTLYGEDHFITREREEEIRDSIDDLREMLR